MAAPQKKVNRDKEFRTTSNVFKWTPSRLKAAKMLSTGLYSFDEIQEEVRIKKTIFWEWRQSPIFLEEVDKLTLELREVKKAGLIRETLHLLEIKRRNISEDRSTFLNCLEFLVKILPTETKSSDDKLKALTDAIMLSSRKP